jgi:hypothetical protein
MKESKPRSMTDQERESLQAFYQQVKDDLDRINKEVKKKVAS